MPIYKQITEITNIDDLLSSVERDIEEVYFGDKNVFTVWDTYDGTLPATYSANGSTLADYRVYGSAGDRTENSFEVESDMLSSLNWALNPPFGAVPRVYFINYKLSDAVAQELKTGIHTCSIFENFTDGYIPNLLVCAFVPTLTSTVDSAYRILTNQGVTSIKTFDFSEWHDIYLVIGYGNGFDTEANKQSKINELFENWRISIVEGSTAPAEYAPYGYEVDMSVSDGTTSTTTPIYIGDDPLEKDEYVDYKEQKIYRMVNGVLTPQDPPVALPALPTCDGTTIVDYAGQSVAVPEKVELTYRKEGFN